MLIGSVTLAPKIKRCNDSRRLHARRAQNPGKSLSRWPIQTIEGEKSHPMSFASARDDARMGLRGSGREGIKALSEAAHG